MTAGYVSQRPLEAELPAGGVPQRGVPSFLQLEPVGVCNLRCRMCLAPYRQDIPSGRAPALLRREDFEKILDELAGVDSLHLQGLGEPLLHPELFSLVRLAKGRGMEVTTNSNVHHLSERTALECLESGLDRLHVSIDAADADLYGRIRPRGSLERVVRNLSSLLRLRRDAGPRHLRVHIVGVLMRSTLDEVPGLVLLAAQLGVDALSLQALAQDLQEPDLPASLHPLRARLASELLRPSDLERAGLVFAYARRIALSSGLDLRLPQLPEARARVADGAGGRCTWPWSGMYVTCRGEVIPCCMIGLPERVTLGNAFREGALGIWQGDRMSDFRHRLEHGPTPSVCRGCSVYRGEF